MDEKIRIFFNLYWKITKAWIVRGKISIVLVLSSSLCLIQFSLEALLTFILFLTLIIGIFPLFITSLIIKFPSSKEKSKNEESLDAAKRFLLILGFSSIILIVLFFFQLSITSKWLLSGIQLIIGLFLFIVIYIGPIGVLVFLIALFEVESERSKLRKKRSVREKSSIKT